VIRPNKITSPMTITLYPVRAHPLSVLIRRGRLSCGGTDAGSGDSVGAFIVVPPRMSPEDGQMVSGGEPAGIRPVSARHASNVDALML
jgi:hypothetical protein